MADEMMVYEALRRIGALKGKIGELRRRAAASVTYEEKKEPAFDTRKCMADADTARGELIRLQAGVHQANARATIKWQDREMTVDEAVRWREEYTSEIAWLNTLTHMLLAKDSIEDEAFAIDDENKRKRVTKIRKCTLPEAEHAKLKDQVQEMHDQINMLIEKSNRQTPVNVG
jgi:hypothetical protein